VCLCMHAQSGGHMCICADGGSMHLCKVGLLQWDYMVLDPRRLSSSFLPL
jgi:hypothetical protein